MAETILYGNPQSTYVRTARLALEEKGVAYEIDPVAIGSPENAAVHPFTRVPSLRHGEYLLYETSAIVRYVDEAFDGPALQPSEPRGRAEMEKWISAIKAYFDSTISRVLVAERVLAPRMGRQPDLAAIAAVLPRIDYELSVLDGDLVTRPYLAGETVSLADFFLVPIAFRLKAMPEGPALMKDRLAIARWMEAMEARASVRATDPSMPKAAE